MTHLATSSGIWPAPVPFRFAERCPWALWVAHEPGGPLSRSTRAGPREAQAFGWPFPAHSSMYVPEAVGEGRSPVYPNPSRRRRITRIIVPLLVGVAVILGLVVVADWSSHGAAAALRLALALFVVESVVLAYASALIVGRAPRQVWRAGDEIVFRAHRVAGGYLSSSEVSLRLADIRQVGVVGPDAMVVGTGRVGPSRDAPSRLFSEWIVVDASLLGPLGLEPETLRRRVPPSGGTSTLLSDPFGVGIFRRGQSLMLLGGGLIIVALVTDSLVRPSGEWQSILGGVIVVLGAVCLVGASLAIAGMAKRARGRVDVP